MTIAFAMARTLVQRHRIGMSIAGGYALMATLAIVILKESHTPLFAAFVMFSGLIVAAFYLVTVFVHADSDVATPGSSYPTYYFTLPVRTADLVVWPVTTGILCLGGLTFLISLAIKGAGYALDPILATLIVTSLLTVLQAIFWFPFGIPYSKLVLTVGASAGLIVLGMACTNFGITEPQRMALFVAVILGAFAMIWLGVSKARTGDSFVGKVDREISFPKIRTSSKPFRSAEQAQLWYEWRNQGKTLPVIAIVMFFVFLTPSFWNDTLSPIPALTNLETGWMPTVPTYLQSYYPFAVVLMGLYGWAVGCGARRMDLKRGDRTFQLVFGTRPLSDEALVWAKMKVAALSTLVAWGLLVVLSIPLLFVHGGHIYADTLVGESAPLYSLFVQYMNPEVALKVLCAVAIMVFLTWRNYAIGFWAELSGSLTLRYLQPMVAFTLYLVLSIKPEDWRPGDNLIWLPVILGSLLAFKLGWTAFIAVRQRRSGIISAQSLLRVLLGYSGGVLLVGAAAFYILAPRWADIQWEWNQAMTLQISLALTVALYVPLARILGAVSMLSRNRHR